MGVFRKRCGYSWKPYELDTTLLYINDRKLYGLSIGTLGDDLGMTFTGRFSTSGLVRDPKNKSRGWSLFRT